MIENKIEWSAERANFPALRDQTYFNSAATGPTPVCVHEAFIGFANTLHYKGDVGMVKLLALIKESHDLLADYFNAGADDVGFCANTSHGMNLVAMMVKQKHPQGGEIVLPEDEFPSSFVAWAYHGFRLKKVKSDELLENISNDTVAVLTSAVQFGTGYRQNDLERLGTALEAKGIPFIVNATQAIGAFPIDVQKAKVTALTASCHKWLCAEYGMSGFYLNPEFKKDKRWPIIGWLSREDPFDMEYTDESVRQDVGAVEMGCGPLANLPAVVAALKNVKRIGLENISQRIFSLSCDLEKELKAAKLPLEIVSRRDEETDYRQSINSGILSLQMCNAEDIAEKLKQDNIIVSCRQGRVRVAVHYFNNHSDIETLVRKLKALL